MTHVLLTEAVSRFLAISLQSACVALLVAIVTVAVGRRVAPAWQVVLWSLVFVRLLAPVLPVSRASIFHLIVDHPDSDTVVIAPAGATFTAYSLSLASGEFAYTDATPHSTGAHASSALPHLSFVFTLIWLTGLILLAAKWIVASIQFRRALSREQCCRAISSKIPPRDGVAVVQTSLVQAPAIWGLLRPTILLPHDLLHRLSPEQLEFILQHELAHHHRRDLILFLLTDTLSIIHWFNPFVWFARHHLRLACELACDDAVLAKASAPTRVRYGETILRVLETFSSSSRTVGASMINGRTGLRRRLIAIGAERKQWRILGPLLIIVIAATALTAAPATNLAISSSTNLASTLAPEGNVVTCVYDVSNLVVDVPDFSSTTKPAVRRRDEVVRDLITSITSSIDPLSWKANAGSVGSIQESNGKLIVTQKADTQNAVQRKIQTLLGKRLVQVTLQERLFRGQAAERLMEGSGEPWITIKDGEVELWPHFLNEAQVHALIRAIQDDHDSEQITAPRMTMFNNQRCGLDVSRDVFYVADYKAVGPAFEPVAGTCKEGIQIDCQAHVSDDQQLVTMNLRPRLTRVHLVSSVWPNSGQKDPNRRIQTPQLEQINLDAVLTMPNDQTAIYRIRPHFDPASTMQSEPCPYILMVQPTVLSSAIQGTPDMRK